MTATSTLIASQTCYGGGCRDAPRGRRGGRAEPSHRGVEVASRQARTEGAQPPANFPWAVESWLNLHVKKMASKTLRGKQSRIGAAHRWYYRYWFVVVGFAASPSFFTRVKLETPPP
jgi:hypothetical protein